MRRFLFLVLPLLSLLIFASCGDNLSSPYAPDAGPPDAPRTWREAWSAWAGAWCGYYERCFPETFAERWGSREVCVEYAVGVLCTDGETSHPCDSPADPSRDDEVAECVFDMARISCDAGSAPASCVRAFE